MNQSTTPYTCGALQAIDFLDNDAEINRQYELYLKKKAKTKPVISWEIRAHILYQQLEKQQFELFYTFVRTNMSMDEYLSKYVPLEKRSLRYTKIVTKDDIGEKHYRHEMIHKGVMDRYGIKSEIRQSRWGKIFIVDRDIKRVRKMGKQKYLQMLAESTKATNFDGVAEYEGSKDEEMYTVINQNGYTKI